MDGSRLLSHRPSGPFAAVALTLVVVLAACGNDGDDGAASGPTSSSSSSSSTTNENCSAANLPADPTSVQDLTEPVTEMRRSIVAAASACDFERLADLARPGGFTHSFGDDGDPAAAWRRAEADGEPLATLVRLLNRPFATRPAGDVTQYVWPRAYAYATWAAVPGEAREELRPIYGTEDFKRFERFGSYNGYRIGITAGGDWAFFVGGD